MPEYRIRIWDQRAEKIECDRLEVGTGAYNFWRNEQIVYSMPFGRVTSVELIVPPPMRIDEALMIP